MKLTEASALIERTLADDTINAKIVLRDICKKYKYRMPEVLARATFERVATYTDPKLRSLLGHYPSDNAFLCR